MVLLAPSPESRSFQAMATSHYFLTHEISTLPLWNTSQLIPPFVCPSRRLGTRKYSKSRQPLNSEWTRSHAIEWPSLIAILKFPRIYLAHIPNPLPSHTEKRREAVLSRYKNAQAAQLLGWCPSLHTHKHIPINSLTQHPRFDSQWYAHARTL